VLTNLWLTALNQLQPTYVRCPEGKPSCSQTACLIKAGTLLNIWLYFHHGRTRDCECQWKACVLDLRLDQKIDGASGCLHSCMHCGEAQGDTMEACVHRMLYCSAVQSSGRVSLSGLWPKAELGSTRDRTWCILFCLQNGTLIRPASTRFVIDCSRTPVPNRFVQVGVCGGGWIYGGGWIWS
jgi:hypothetical protein